MLSTIRYAFRQLTCERSPRARAEFNTVRELPNLDHVWHNQNLQPSGSAQPFRAVPNFESMPTVEESGDSRARQRRALELGIN